MSEEKQTDFEPCPFCGDSSDIECSESYIQDAITGDHKFAVFCNSCFCEGPVTDNFYDAITAWNHREKAAPVQQTTPQGQNVLPNYTLKADASPVA
jgi:Lar family restriction alleviation protein